MRLPPGERKLHPVGETDHCLEGVEGLESLTGVEDDGGQGGVDEAGLDQLLDLAFLLDRELAVRDAELRAGIEHAREHAGFDRDRLIGGEAGRERGDRA